MRKLLYVDFPLHQILIPLRRYRYQHVRNARGPSQSSKKNQGSGLLFRTAPLRHDSNLIPFHVYLAEPRITSNRSFARTDHPRQTPSDCAVHTTVSRVAEHSVYMCFEGPVPANSPYIYPPLILHVKICRIQVILSQLTGLGLKILGVASV